MNPLLNSNDSPNNATQPSKAVNRQGVSVPHTHNSIDDSYFHFKTHRYGFYEPFFVMETVAGDRVPFSNSHNVRSLPFSAPFLSSLKLNKDYFMVPYQAILPNTWEYIFKTPSQGDDVPSNAQPNLPLFAEGYDVPFFIQMLQNLHGFSDPVVKFFMLLNCELFLSQGSLFSLCGYKLNPQIYIVDSDLDNMSFDSFFDKVFRDNVARGFGFSFTLPCDDRRTTYNNNNCSYRQFLSLARMYGSEMSLTLDSFDVPFITVSGYSNRSQVGDNDSIRILRPIAYQLSCAQYYVNPQVDFIYNAQLYRDNINTLHRFVLSFYGVDPEFKCFDYNGTVIPYDFTSRTYFQDIVNIIPDIDFIEDFPQIAGYIYDYFNALFGLRETLKFGDYFVDSRTRPLAIGNDRVDVDRSSVSVVDISKSIVYQRFRNAVIKLGQNFGDYLRGIYGESPTPDYHVPKFIIHQDFDISGFEVANQTGVDQGTMVTNLQSGDDTSVFDIDSSMDSILIGISSFSVPQLYSQTKDRFFFHKDRYDMFNPMLQYIGDQEVLNIERTDLRPSNPIFGYQSRNNEYKQRLSIVSSGFATALPSWAFVSDSLFLPGNYLAVADTQSPDFIRTHDYDFDRFFAAMPGYSISNAFHFIVVFDNKCVANRPMEINPNIL